MKKVVILLAAMLLVPMLLVAAGCGDESSNDAEKHLCEDLQDLKTSLATLKDLSLQSSLDDLDDAAEAVKDDCNKVMDSASKVADVQTDDLRAAMNDLMYAIHHMPPGTSIAEALQSISGQVSEVESAWTEMTQRVNCDEMMGE